MRTISLVTIDATFAAMGYAVTARSETAVAYDNPRSGVEASPAVFSTLVDPLSEEDVVVILEGAGIPVNVFFENMGAL